MRPSSSLRYPQIKIFKDLFRMGRAKHLSEEGRSEMAFFHEKMFSEHGIATHFNTQRIV